MRGTGLAQVELDAGCGGPLPRLGEHRRGRVDPDHRTAGGARHGDRHTAASHRKLDEGPLGLGGELDVERDVLRHVRGPLVVDGREGIVSAHEADDTLTR
jgi:hypothetical protein